MTIHQSTEIFKLDSKGKIRTWQYVVEGDSWWTIAGLQDGNKVTSAPTVCVPASQPTAEEQALFEAKAEETKKLKRDYHLTVEGTATAKYFAPMLAEKYDPTDVEPGDLAQPKLDGIRSVTNIIRLASRKGELISSCPHISAALQPLFDLYPDLVLDGELYNHAFKNDFNELASIIRKKTPDAEQLERAARDIEFHVYDLVFGGDLEMVTEDRIAKLNELLLGLHNSNSPIVIVPTEPVANDAEMRAFFAKQVALGYEGAMHRKKGQGYHQKRSKALRKFKVFQTAEFEVSRLIEGEGNWAGHAKAVEFIVRDDAGNEVLTESGERPKGGIKGNKAFTKELLTRAVKIVTLQFFEMTPAGVPRFGVAIDFDRSDA